MIEWVNALVQGILLGGLYALFAAGLSLIFGVMRLVNIAHGDLIVLAAYLGLSTTIMLGVHPFVALMIVMPVMAGVGYVLQRGLLNQTLGDDILPPLRFAEEPLVKLAGDGVGSEPVADAPVD